MAVFMTAWFFYASLWILKSAILVNCEGKPKLRGKPQTQYSAYLGDSVKLKCPVSGTDGLAENRTLVAWYKGEVIIHFSHKNWPRYFKHNKKHLKILNVQGEDAGKYKCTAVNKIGKVELSIELKVKSIKKPGRGKPPKFKQFPKKKMTFKTGETAKLHCHSSGDPDPNVQWFKDGKSYGVEKRTSVGVDGWTLNLRYLREEDGGLYTCRVSNNVGSINRTFTVVVKARVLKPIIAEPDMARHTANQGRSVKFDCKVTSVGQVDFNWRWSGNKANSSIDLKNSKQFGSKYIGNYTKTHEVSMNRFYFDGFLVIRDVRKEDEGRYTCLVENNHGRDEMDFYLRVRGKEEQRLLSTTRKPPVVVATKGKVHTTEKTIPIMLVAVLTASIIVAMIFIVVLIMCCRKQRKDLEKQYVDEYQPQDLFQPYAQQISVYQEMQKFDQNDSNCKTNGDNAVPVKASKDARASLQSSLNSCGTHSDSKRAPSSSSEMYLANSRTSLQTTLCRGCPRETSLDYKGRTQHSLPRRTESTPGVQNSEILPRGVSSPGVSTTDRDAERRDWESQGSLDDSPRNTSPQRSRESIV